MPRYLASIGLRLPTVDQHLVLLNHVFEYACTLQ